MVLSDVVHLRMPFSVLAVKIWNFFLIKSSELLCSGFIAMHICFPWKLQILYLLAGFDAWLLSKILVL